MAKHKIEGVSSIGIGETMVKGEKGVFDIPHELEKHPDWARLHAELVIDPNINIEPVESKKAN